MAGVETRQPAEQVPWGLIATAFDYRVRFYFPWQNSAILAAYTGAQLACKDLFAPSLQVQGEKEGIISSTVKPFDWQVAKDFFISLRQFVHRTKCERRRLEKTDEDALLRYCVVLAAFDIEYGHFDERSILRAPHPKTSLNELLSAAEPHWIDDLREMSWGFFDNFYLLLDQPATLGPDFGGVYGDLIVGNCLIDVKTTIRPLEKFTYRIYQLLAYTLVDRDDKYQLREVAIYFSRQQFLLKWSLDELIAELSGDNALTMNDLRLAWTGSFR
jgi:hypothetical protein